MGELQKQLSAIATVLIPKLEPVISGFLQTHPEWQMAFHQSIGLYGYYMALKQEDVNEFVEFIRDNPETFRQEIVTSEEFQNGFVQSFKTYLEVRTQEKKKVVQNIFLGFTQSDNKEQFPLERLDSALLQISEHAIHQLVFIQEIILPYKEKTIRDEIDEVKPTDPENWFLTTTQREPIWKYISSWIHENYNPNSEKVKNEAGVSEWKDGVPNELWERERAIREDFLSAIEEYITLGIMKMKVSSEGFVASPSTSYDFTSFGKDFLSYIQEMEVSNHQEIESASAVSD